MLLGQFLPVLIREQVLKPVEVVPQTPGRLLAVPVGLAILPHRVVTEGSVAECSPADRQVIGLGQLVANLSCAWRIPTTEFLRVAGTLRRTVLTKTPRASPSQLPPYVPVLDVSVVDISIVVDVVIVVAAADAFLPPLSLSVLPSPSQPRSHV